MDDRSAASVAKRRRMVRWLMRTGWLELGNVLLFSGALWSWGLLEPRVIAASAVAGTLVFDSIALQAGAYWLLKQRGRFADMPARTRGRILAGLYVIDAVLLLAFPAVLIAAAASGEYSGALWWGLACYLLALGKFLHYFVCKINTYSVARRRPEVLSPGRLLREIRRARTQHA